VWTVNAFVARHERNICDLLQQRELFSYRSASSTLR